MSVTRPISRAVTPLSWRELVLPKEHGSWAFAFVLVTGAAWPR